MSLGQLKATWESLGQVDPLWAVLSDPERRHGRWDVEDFMATGRAAVDWIERALDEHGLTLGDSVLDFGCGAGRLSNALAERVGEVVGVDIAESMVEQAKALSRHPDRIRFVGYDGRTLPFTDGAFDGAVSMMVLQHARPAVQLGCLLELQRVVRLGGVLVVQIPSHPRTSAALPAAAMRAGIEVLAAPNELGANRSATVRARVTNLGEAVWRADQLVKLGNHWFDGDAMVIQDDGRTDLPHDLEPGASVELELLVTAPAVPGRYRLELDMVQEFVAWWKDAGGVPASVAVDVPAGSADAPPEVVPEPPQEDGTAEPADSSERPGTMEMHGLHTDLVTSLFAHCGSVVVAAIPDDCAGPEWESYTYVVRRHRT